MRFPELHLEFVGENSDGMGADLGILDYGVGDTPPFEQFWGAGNGVDVWGACWKWTSIIVTVRG